MPDHKPIWTTVGVQRLGEDDMRVEIEVVAYDPKWLLVTGKMVDKGNHQLKKIRVIIRVHTPFKQVPKKCYSPPTLQISKRFPIICPFPGLRLTGTGSNWSMTGWEAVGLNFDTARLICDPRRPHYVKPKRSQVYLAIINGELLSLPHMDVCKGFRQFWFGRTSSLIRLRVRLSPNVNLSNQSRLPKSSHAILIASLRLFLGETLSTEGMIFIIKMIDHATFGKIVASVWFPFNIVRLADGN